jgi:hypothetical protein
MIRWLIYLIPSLLSTVLCYLTNWFVVLFADRDGELPGIFHLWQTWDDSVFCKNSRDNAPSFLQYDWEKHYREYYDTNQLLKSWNRGRWYVACVDNDFTISELIKRYCCGVLWLMRNNAYGFAFYLLGATVTPLLAINTSENTISVYEINGDAWMYKNTAPIFSAFGYVVHWNNLLGWKIDESAKYDTRAMIANRVAFFFEREGEE